MIDRTLMRAKKNDVYLVLEYIGLKPFLHDFDWSKHESKVKGEVFSFSVLSYIQDERKLYFRFTRNASDTKWAAEYFPGDDNKKKKLVAGNWEEELEHVKEWANELKKEIAAPDYWAEIARVQKDFGLTLVKAKKNVLISPEEIKKLKENFDRIEQKVTKMFSKNEEEESFIRSQFQLLTESIKKFDKKTFIYFSIGVLVSIAMGLRLSALDLQRYWQIIKPILEPTFRLLVGN